MENDNGLDLGLGLSCGGSSSKSTAKAATCHDSQINDGDKTISIVDGFKGFHHVGVRIEDINIELSRPQENFFDILSSNGHSLAQVEENLFDASHKRKSFFNDLKNQKKHEYEAHDGGLYDKAKTSHISITSTDEVSAAENEDVADSAVDGFVSRFAADHDPRSNQQSVGVASSGVQKQAHGHINLGAGQMGFNISSEYGPKSYINMQNVQYGIHRPNLNSVPLNSFSMESGGVTIRGPSGHHSHNVIQMGPNESWDQTVTPGNNISLTFGYAPAQSQPLSKDHQCGIPPRPQQLYPPFDIRPTGRVVTDSDKDNVELMLPQGSGQLHQFNTLESSMQNGTGVLPAKGTGNQHGAEEVQKTNSPSATPTLADGISSMYTAIRPGIDADVKFDGTGSSPNLPWVSTTGSGPNGRTISGVAYTWSPNQIKIVCACHGSHMTPEDFIKHANANDVNKNHADASADVPSYNPTASSQN